MPINTTTRKVGPFIGSGSASTFAFGFKVFLPSDLLVVRTDANGNETNLVLNSDYSVALNGNQDTSPGGTVTLTAGPLATGFNLTITSDIPELQQTELTNAGGFYPEVITSALDLLTILIQQLQVGVTRALTAPVSDPNNLTLPPASQRAGKFLYFDTNGNVEMVAVVPPNSSVFSGALLGTVDGTNKIFSLANNGVAIGKAPLQATVWQNIPLAPGVGYTLGPQPGQITFTNAPVATDTLFAQGSY